MYVDDLEIEQEIEVIKEQQEKILEVLEEYKWKIRDLEDEIKKIRKEDRNFEDNLEQLESTVEEISSDCQSEICGLISSVESLQRDVYEINEYFD